MALPAEYLWLPYDPYLLSDLSDVLKLSNSDRAPLIDVGFGMLGDFTVVVRFKKYKAATATVNTQPATQTEFPSLVFRPLHSPIVSLSLSLLH